MAICAGLVGLPNVGKSTLFNALTRSSVPAENYPFCTIDPHVACATVPDERLEILQKIYQSQKIIPAPVQFVDIAGLVKGAASGEGLGNQFLSHIRAVDLILHVVRCFEDGSITHTSNEVDPLLDFDIVQHELMLKDIESLSKRAAKVAHLVKAHKQQPAVLKELEAEQALITALEHAFNNDDIETIRTLLAQSKVPLQTDLLCAKKFLIIANISEQEIENDGYTENKHYQRLIKRFGSDRVIPVCARLEGELAQLNHEEAADMMHMMGLRERGLDHIIAAAYRHLGLITFFTCGPQEIHAWPIKAGISIRTAAGEIHSDLERGFICAEVFSYHDLVAYKTVAKLKEAGKMRTEGHEYKVQDGDIVLVKFNV